MIDSMVPIILPQKEIDILVAALTSASVYVYNENPEASKAIEELQEIIERQLQPTQNSEALVIVPCSIGKRYFYKGVTATVAEGITDKTEWATIYSITSLYQNKGYCQELLVKLQYLYRDVSFGSTVALNSTMKHILKKLKIKEYT